MEGQNTPPSVYAPQPSGNTPPPAFAPSNDQQYIQYPQFIPTRQIISNHPSLSSNHIPQLSDNYNQPLIKTQNKEYQQQQPQYHQHHQHHQHHKHHQHYQHDQQHHQHHLHLHPSQHQQHQQQQLIQPQIVIVRAPQTLPLNHNNNISYPQLNKNNNNNDLNNKLMDPNNQQTPSHINLFSLALISFLFCPILGLLAMCRATQANNAYARGDYTNYITYNRESRRYMKCGILLCIVFIIVAICVNMM